MSSFLLPLSAVLASALPAATTSPNSIPAERPPATLRTLYGLPRTASIDPGRTALVLVDFQREFLDGGLPLPDAAAAAERARELLRWARSRGVLVVVVRQLAAGPGPLFAPGSSGAELLPGFEPRDGDWTVTKSAAGAFTRTDLAGRLAARGIDRLIVAGFMTHLAVDSTARDATVLGLHVVVASDATATRALPSTDGALPLDHRTQQRAALAALADRFAEILSVEELKRLPVEARGSSAAPSDDHAPSRRSSPP